MSVDRALLAQYLRQLADLGIRELYFDDLTAEQALALLRGAGPAAPRGARVAPPQTAAAPPAGAQHARAGAAAAAEPHAPADSLRSIREMLAAQDATAVATRKPSIAPGTRTAAPATRAAASGALDVLMQEAHACVHCRLHAERTNVVFGEGDPAARVVVVGEAPGQEEDRTGRPFVGRAGKLLDLLLSSAGFSRENVYICNTLKCRPPNNRNPLPDEVEACAAFLRGQLAAIAPRVLLAVGKFAAQALLQSEESIGRLRGTVHTHRGTPLIVTYHPAFLLRSPQMTRTAWQDFQLLRRVHDEQA